MNNNEIIDQLIKEADEVKYDIVVEDGKPKVKKKKFARTHGEAIRTCVSVMQLVIGCLTLLRVFGKI